MSSKVMITYKRKRVTSRCDTANETVHDSSAAASNNVVASSFPSKYETDAENNLEDEDNLKEQPEICCASTKQHGVCMPASQIIKDELANQSTHAGEKKLQLCESLLQKEQPEICCVASGSTAEAQSYKLQCTDDTNSLNPVLSSVCDSMDLDGMTNRTEDSKASALLEMNSHQEQKILVRSDQCKSRFSPLLTFRRRVKKKNISDEIAEENCSPDNKQCSALTCSPPSSSMDATHLLKHTGRKTSDIEPKFRFDHEVYIILIEWTVIALALSSRKLQWEVVDYLYKLNTCMNKKVSKFTGVVEVSEKDARVENSSKTLPGAIEVPEVIDVQEQGHANGQTSSLQSPRQVINGQFGNAPKQMSQPIETMFFTKEKDTMLGKQQQHEGSSTIPTLYSNRFDQTSCWNTGNFKAPSLPSELKFRIMDKIPEFNLDLSLDSFPDNSVSSRRRNKLFLGRNPGVSHKLTEKLGTYSYKRHLAPWSEEELDFLWIGVRRFLSIYENTWSGSCTTFAYTEDYLGRGSCSGCSKSLFLAAQTDLSLGDVYLQNVCGPGRGEHHLSNLDMLNLHRIDSAPRNMSLGGFPGASSSHGRSSGRHRRASKFHKSYYDKASWFQEPSGRLPQLFPIVNQQPMNNGLPQWLTKDAETGRSRVNPEMWPSMAPPPGHSAADLPSDNLRGASLFIHDMKPHALPDASLKRTIRNADWRSFSKRLFRTGDALDLNQGAAGPNGATASDTGASSEETVSDS
ncbi:hypothetical protein PR202_gb10133 [Eleusine coracana subsp. coracana]|uniref:Uncharacterized protein n=1 Tax=Eleusine coracana subsp. coracana TaxID=191504 RepID=A0AAV5EJW9_ELECO|nr:hypothetical protein PR202_gb10133 [Eleusine coracana subsp. coracana]